MHPNVHKSTLSEMSKSMQCQQNYPQVIKHAQASKQQLPPISKPPGDSSSSPASSSRPVPTQKHRNTTNTLMHDYSTRNAATRRRVHTQRPRVTHQVAELQWPPMF